MNPKIWLSSPHMGGNELAYVHQAFETNWIAPLGPHVDGFEKDLQSVLGGHVQVAALNSGTSALHLALVILGVKAGDEVICQSLTFAASANPVVYQGATPVFVDSEESTMNISPEYLERAICDRVRKGKKPRAIVVVHLYGMPASMDAIMAIARDYDIPVVEDAAEALGSSYNGRMLGTFGDIGILSFNGNKIITTSGGGALLSARSTYIQKARFLATQAQDPAPHYQHSHIGYNYRMSNVCAAIGRGQLQVLPQRVQQRRRNFEFYKEALSDIPGIRFTEEPDDRYFSNRWLTTIQVDKEYITATDVRNYLADDNIDSRPVWKPMHLQPVYAAMPFYGNHTADRLFEKGLCLPSGSNLTEKELERIVTRIRYVFEWKKHSQKYTGQPVSL
jgi:dTDP-4-amino-4,6-dideoxygalactose transaminase